MVALSQKGVPISIQAEIERKSPRFAYLMKYATKKEIDQVWEEIQHGSRS